MPFLVQRTDHVYCWFLRYVSKFLVSINLRFVSFQHRLHSFLSASFLILPFLIRRGNLNFFSSIIFTRKLLRGEAVSGCWKMQSTVGKLFSVYSGVGNNFFLTFHSSRNGRGGGMCVKGIVFEGGNGIIDYNNLSVYLVYIVFTTMRFSFIA